MGNKAVKVVNITSWVLFGLSSTLIIAESATPTGASGQQSSWFSSIMASIVNTLTPPKRTVTYEPTAISATGNVVSGKDEEGNLIKLYEENQAIVGTTKMYSYQLSYPEGKADVYDSSVKVKTISSPGEGSFSYTLTTSTKSGALRLIPLEVGHYELELVCSNDIKNVISFDAVKPLSPKGVLSDVASLEIGAGEYAYYPFALSLGDLKRTDTSTDHYLARYVDRGLAQFRVDDPSIVTVENGGVLLGKSAGETALYFGDSKLCDVHVEGTYAAGEVSRIELAAPSTVVSPLDYDYAPPGVEEAYGSQVEVKYFDALGNELVGHQEPVVFSSEDELIAKVDNDHLELDKDGNYAFVAGGFVAGYRKKGETKIHAKLLNHPEVESSILFTSKEVPPTSVEVKATSNGAPLNAEGAKLTTGSSIAISGTFAPLNASDTRLHVEVSDTGKLAVLNNDTNSPSINVIAGGEATFTVSSVAIGPVSGKTYALTIEAKQVINDDNIKDFHDFIRKAAGHFSLFLVTGVFASVAFYLTFFRKNRFQAFIVFGLLVFTGFVLAGVSEWIQAIPSLHRGSSWSDVGIDTAGFFVSALVAFIVVLIRRAMRKNKE